MSRQQSGFERILEILRMPLLWRKGKIQEFSGLAASVTIGAGLVAALIFALLWFLFFAGGNPGREPGSGRGDSSGGGRNDDSGFDDGYEAPEGTDFDFAVMLGNKPLRTWKHEDVAKLDKRKVSVPGEGDFEGTSLLTLIDESGEDDWDFVALSGSTYTTVQRDEVDDDWILIYEPPDPGIGAPLATYTLLVPDRPRSEWPNNINQFDVRK